jgi:hypothetical protein
VNGASKVFDEAALFVLVCTTDKVRVYCIRLLHWIIGSEDVLTTLAKFKQHGASDSNG